MQKHVFQFCDLSLQSHHRNPIIHPKCQQVFAVEWLIGCAHIGSIVFGKGSNYDLGQVGKTHFEYL